MKRCCSVFFPNILRKGLTGWSALLITEVLGCYYLIYNEEDKAADDDDNNVNVKDAVPKRGVLWN